jgi:hypothetical protein
MPWYDGLTMEEVDWKLQSGEVEGCKVPGGIIQVPNGYIEWTCNKLAEARYRADPDCLGLWRQGVEQEADRRVAAERERVVKLIEEALLRLRAETDEGVDARDLWANAGACVELRLLLHSIRHPTAPASGKAPGP